MARLAPAELWQIRKHMGISDSSKLEEAMQVQVCGMSICCSSSGWLLLQIPIILIMSPPACR
jgi:hypothetical protein